MNVRWKMWLTSRTELPTASHAKFVWCTTHHNVSSGDNFIYVQFAVASCMSSKVLWRRGFTRVCSPVFCPVFALALSVTNDDVLSNSLLNADLPIVTEPAHSRASHSPALCAVHSSAPRKYNLLLPFLWTVLAVTYNLSICVLSMLPSHRSEISSVSSSRILAADSQLL